MLSILGESDDERKKPGASAPPGPGRRQVDLTEQWATGRLLCAVARRIERDWNAHLAAWDVNQASVHVLLLLVTNPLSQRDLAHASGVTEQTMSRIVARLERSGYLDRRADPDDARRHQVVLTDAGRVVVQEAGDLDTAEEISARGLDPDQVAQLRCLLVSMIEAGRREEHPTGSDVAPAPVSDRTVRRR
jgi:DNA-binding MarR family transcriptional regulator